MTRRTTEVRPASRESTRPIVGEADATLVYAVRGGEGAAALEIFTGWFLPNALVGVETLDASDFPEAIVGFHSPMRISSDLKRVENCPVLKTAACWGDGSSLAGRYVMRRLLLDGESAVWGELEELYDAAFKLGAGSSHIQALQARGRQVTY
jgi:hypothetical protein